MATNNAANVEIVPGGSATYTFPAATDTLIGRISTDTGATRLQNKELDDANTKFVDTADTTKKLTIDVAGTTGINGILQSIFTTAKTLTLPDATDTLVGKNTTDILTNKVILHSYSPGSFTVPTETGKMQINHLKLTTTQRVTLQGTGRLTIIN